MFLSPSSPPTMTAPRRSNASWVGSPPIPDQPNSSSDTSSDARPTRADGRATPTKAPASGTTTTSSSCTSTTRRSGHAPTRDNAWIGGHSENLDQALRQLFHYAVTHLLAHHRRYVLHAAGVAAENGRAYLVIGASGQGKSSLALAAVTSGWRVLSDDLVIVRRGTSGLEASGIPRRVAVPGDLAALLDVRGHPIPGDRRDRWELATDDLSRGWFPIAGVVVVGHSLSPDGELQTLCAEQAMYRVLGAFSSVTDPLLLTEFFPVAGSLCQLPRWRLGHGADAPTRLGVAQRLLEQLTAQ